jgi:hypothetical protein
MAKIVSSLNFACPICGADPQGKCELISGAPRFESHVERWDIAKDHFLEAERLAFGRLESVI